MVIVGGRQGYVLLLLSGGMKEIIGRGSESHTAFFFVVATGLLGIFSAILIYSDASSRGEQYLQDSLWIIYLGLALGIFSLLFSIYILRSRKKA